MSGLVEYSADARSKTIGQNFRVRAWVKCNLGGTVQDSQNVTSVGHSTGQYTVNFANDMPNADYAVVCATAAYSSNDNGKYANFGVNVQGTSSVSFIFVNPGVNYYNIGAVHVAVFA
tara:strand:- start:420 stop:770 length:351 start_codon:yes stop_codon:yes gene_type:complete